MPDDRMSHDTRGRRDDPLGAPSRWLHSPLSHARPLASPPSRARGRGWRALATVSFLCGALVAAAQPAAAQGGNPDGKLERLGVDRLRLSTIGVTSGAVKPATIEATTLVSVHADYGEVVPRWRLVFSATYWNSRYTDAVVQELADSLRAIVNDPTGDATVEVGTVRVSVISVAAEGRWSPRSGRQRFRPYLGGGLGVYALNAEGRGISGTLVEDALDNFATGLAAIAGADLLLFPNLSVGAQARYDLLGGARYGSVRAGVSYVFRSHTGA